MADERRRRDKALGMDRPIDRRDFLNGVAVAIGALGSGALGGAAIAQQAGWPQDQAGYYPPLLTGLRGSHHPGSFENAHGLQGRRLLGEATRDPTDTGERYDLVIVGGGISGLSAAHFYRKAKPGRTPAS